MSVLNLSQVQSVATLVQQTLSQSIVRPTGGINSIGISGFLFDIISVEEVSNQADITDHYIEDNTSIQDHVALRPRRFTLRGYSGELNDDLQQALAQLFSSVTGILPVGTYLPVFTRGAQQTYSQIQVALEKTNQAISEANNLFGVFQTFSTMATKQQAAYNALLAMQQSRQFCAVDTPYGTFNNMIIEDLRARQDDRTLMVSEFSVTFKEIRIVSTVVSTITISSLGRVANAASVVANNGPAPGTETSSAQIAVDFSNASVTG